MTLVKKQKFNKIRSPDWWPWTWCVMHIDDIQAGTPCTWISRDDRRPGVVMSVQRDADGHPRRIVAREYVAESTRNFSWWPELAQKDAVHLRDAPMCGMFFLLVGFAEPPADSENIR